MTTDTCLKGRFVPNEKRPVNIEITIDPAAVLGSALLAFGALLLTKRRKRG